MCECKPQLVRCLSSVQSFPAVLPEYYQAEGEGMTGLENNILHFKIIMGSWEFVYSRFSNNGIFEILFFSAS